MTKSLPGEMTGERVLFWPTKPPTRTLSIQNYGDSELSSVIGFAIDWPRFEEELLEDEQLADGEEEVVVPEVVVEEDKVVSDCNGGNDGGQLEQVLQSDGDKEPTPSPEVSGVAAQSNRSSEESENQPGTSSYR